MKSNTETILISLDPGNGQLQAATNARADIIEVEPVLAPRTEKRGVGDDDARPQFTLREGNQTYVFGVDDVNKFGRTVSARRLNAQERYTSEDYFRMIRLLLLQALGAYRGNGAWVQPVVLLCVPVAQYNEPETIATIKKQLLGRHKICDQDGCELWVEIGEKRLTIVPESYGALMRYAFDPRTMAGKGDTTGSTLVIDPGYETTDVSLFVGKAYQRDAAFTIPRAGMGIVARAIQDYARHSLRSADVSLIDKAMRSLATIPLGEKKQIEVSRGVMLDVTDIYDTELANIAAKIEQEVLTNFDAAATRVILAGGSTRHLRKLLFTNSNWQIHQSAAPEDDNVVGGLIALQLAATRKA